MKKMGDAHDPVGCYRVWFGLTSATQAMPIAPMQQPESLTITVREGCGAGFTMVNGQCVAQMRGEAAPR